MLSDSNRKAVSSLVDRSGEFADYYAANDAKHFSSSSPGSTFTDRRLTKTEDVLALAIEQRGNLDGDDRAFFIDEMGSNPESFVDDARYLHVKARGHLGIAKSSEIPDDAVVHFEQHKPDSPASPTVYLQGDKTPTTDDAVIIIGISDGRERVFTTYPGTITPRGTGKTDEFKGQAMSISSFREKFGADVYVNIKLGQPLAEMPTEV